MSESQNAEMAAGPRAAAAPRQRWRVIGRLAAMAAITYLLVMVAMMFLEETFIFPAMRFPGGEWQPDGLAFEDAEFTAGDGVRLHGWFCPVAEPRAVVLMSHGNGGNITHRADEIQNWLTYLNVAVFIYDYRGYGKSAGSPNEQGVYADARAAHRYLTDERRIPAHDIVLHGESLGGAVALDLALDVPCRGLILESSFTSMADMGSCAYPWLPVRWILRNRFESLDKIGRYRGPVLITHGTDDSIVPFEMGRTLFERANEPKWFYAVTGGDHNDLSYIAGTARYRTIADFLDEADRLAERTAAAQ